jgi:MYXO-CTERM domain-containing protein
MNNRVMNNRVMNSRNQGRFSLLLVLLPTAIGCGDDEEFKPAAPFAKADDIQIWATNASAVAVYSHAYEPIGVSDGALTYPDPACPETSDDGTTFTIRGGCTDTSGNEWSGEATVTRDGEDRLLTFDGLRGGADQSERNGTVRLTLTGPSLREFEAHLEIGEVTTIDYVGTVDGDYDSRTVWNGEGRVEREGFPPTGSVDATTVVEVIDNAVCAGQPVSGTTTLRTRDHTAVIEYDGVTDCDPDENARVTVNDEDRGLIGGILCTVTSVGGTRGAPSIPAFLLAVVTIAARLRRRRRD